MRSMPARVGLLAAVIATAVVLFIVLNNGSDDNGGEATTATQTGTSGTKSSGGPQVITVRDGAPVGGVQDLEFDKGDQVQLEVRLDRPEEEVHVHGYEIEKPAETSPVNLRFTADIDGVFEVEVHEPAGDEFEIAELTVNP
jgi:hypothetical protein